MSWWMMTAVGGCVFPSARDPVDGERSVALTAEDLLPHAIKPEAVDPRAETWSVRHDSDGWTLRYGYDLHGLSITYQASVASSVRTAKANAGASGLLGTAVGRMPGVTLVDADRIPWGDEGECRDVRVSALDVGFLCRGRSGVRGFSIAVYGVSPHGGGDPSALLEGPLRALDRWDPEE